MSDDTEILDEFDKNSNLRPQKLIKETRVKAESEIKAKNEETEKAKTQFIIAQKIIDAFREDFVEEKWHRDIFVKTSKNKLKLKGENFDRLVLKLEKIILFPD